MALVSTEERWRDGRTAPTPPGKPPVSSCQTLTQILESFSRKELQAQGPVLRDDGALSLCSSTVSH